MAIILSIVTWAFLHSNVGYITEHEVLFWGGKEPVSEEVKAQFHLDVQPEILYLDSGDAQYFFHANSSCRYSTPLPFQRDDPDNWSLEWMPQFKEEYECIKNYQGRYIIVNADNFDWLGLQKSNRKELNTLLEDNYTLVWTRCWKIYQKNIFK